MASLTGRTKTRLWALILGIFLSIPGSLSLLNFLSPLNPTLNAAPTHKPRLKTLDFSIQYEFKNYFDPVRTNYINLQFLYHSVYSTLFKLDSDLKAYPFLLEKYERKGKQVIFHIKSDARFSDGTPITSTEVIQSIETGMTHSNSPNPVYKAIEGGEELFLGKTQHCPGIKSLGSKTLEILLKDENVQFEYYFTANIMAILPPHRNQGRKLEDMSFSGPFRVVDRQEKKNQTLLTLEPNPYYTGTTPRLNTLRVHFYDTPASLERVILLGRTDVFLYYQETKFPQSRHNYNYFKTPTFGAFYFKLNPLRGPFRDKQLRTLFKNIVLSMDFLRSEKWELAAPCEMVLPYSLTGYFVFDPMVPGDYKKSIPRHPITISCLNIDSGIRKPLMSLLKKKLKNYNINLELNWTNELAKIMAQEREGNIDLTSYYYMADLPLSIYFYETLFTPGHELNLFGYEVPKALELLAAYREESDELKRLRILSQLEALAQEEAFLIPIFNPLSILGYKDSVKNIKIDKFLMVNFEEIDVK